MQIRVFEHTDSESVVALWQTCRLTRPWNDPYSDIERKLDEQPDLFLVGLEEGRVMASIMAGYDGHRGWIYYLAVAPGYRRQSCGRQLMTAIEEKLLARGCPKINLMVRAENSEVRAFYARLGYVQDDIIALGKRLIADFEKA
jgi:ribosomal protein S18 acetylase RimI-like enzyme